MVEQKNNKVSKVIVFVVAIITLLLGIIIGIILGYYTLPHINYTITTQPGTYVFDIGPTAAGVFGQIYTPTNYTTVTTKVLDQGSMPIPDTDTEWKMSDGPRVLIGNGMPTNCCYPMNCYNSLQDYMNSTCNRNCEYPVACYRAPSEEEILNLSTNFCEDIGMEPNDTMVDNTGEHPCVEWVRSSNSKINR